MSRMTHLVAAPVVGLGDGRADPAASDDDDLHVDSSDRVAHDPDGARRVLEDVRDGPADGELATEPLAIGQADDEQVGAALDRLVDDGGADVARLEQDRLERHLVVLGDRLGHVEDALDLLGSAGDVGVERQRPVDLDDVDGDELGLGVAGLVGDEADDPGVARAAVEGDDRSAEDRPDGHLTWPVTIPPGRRRSATAVQAGDASGGVLGPAAGPRSLATERRLEQGRVLAPVRDRRRRPCAAARAGPSAAAWPPGCRGSAPTSCRATYSGMTTNVIGAGLSGGQAASRTSR